MSVDPLETQKFYGSACPFFTKEVVGESRPGGQRKGKKNCLKIDRL